MRRDATLRAWKHARLGFALLAAAVGSVAEGCANDRPIERRQAPANFGFVLETGWGEKVDTFRGLVTKDLVADPDTTIALALSGAELDSVLLVRINQGHWTPVDRRGQGGKEAEAEADRRFPLTRHSTLPQIAARQGVLPG